MVDVMSLVIKSDFVYGTVNHEGNVWIFSPLLGGQDFF